VLFRGKWGYLVLLRVGTILFALLAAVLGATAGLELYSHGELRLVDPILLGGLVILGTGILLCGVLTLSNRAEVLEGRTQQLTELTGELETIVASLSDARDRAQSANSAKTRFLAAMSHEIRTPMSGVLGMARLLQETELAPDQKSYADAISQSGSSLVSIIEEILNFSKIESGTISLDRKELELRSTIESVVELLAGDAHAKHLDLATAISGDVPEIIQADAVRLRQVVTNLVGNAIKFTEEGGVLVAVDVEHSDTGASLRFSVHDTGKGVPEELRTKIFEEFVQADSKGGSHSQGYGLGLSISKKLVHAMGGQIGYTAAPNGGSIFWMSLPMSERFHPREETKPLQGKKIGLVAGSGVVSKSLEHQLRECGAHIFAAENLQALRASQCDLAIFDVGWKGASETNEISNPEIPVFALLAPEQRTERAGLRGQGIENFLTKPLRAKSLVTRIQSALGEWQEEAEVAEPARPQPSQVALKILLAEDNPVNALLLRELLRRRGHSVEHVTTGDAAVASCAEGYFDLVVMDLHMPGLGGIEATHQIRAAENASGSACVPIFALTADALETGRKACQDAGMNGFLTKPVDPTELDSILATISTARIAA
jgi:signal transduction histidine kinase/CheY-like chemotaxis protein